MTRMSRWMTRMGEGGGRRCAPAAGRADEGDGAAGGDAEAHVAQHLRRSESPATRVIT